jgi:transposase
MAQVRTIGLDLAKNVFQVHGIDAQGKVLVRRSLRRAWSAWKPARPRITGGAS